MTTVINLDPTADAEYDAIERALIDVLRRTFGRTFSRTTSAGQRLDKSAYHLMARLQDSGAIRLSDLAALVELDISTISRQVRQIEDAGMISRRPDPDDGRAALVDLTEQGSTMLAEMRRDRHDLLSEAMAAWTHADRAQLGHLMHRLATDLGGLTDSPRTRNREATR